METKKTPRPGRITGINIAKQEDWKDFQQMMKLAGITRPATFARALIQKAIENYREGKKG